MSAEISNETRADWARATLQAYAEIRSADNDDYEANIIDLLTDIRHELARWNIADVDVTRCAQISETHFNAEQDEETEL